MKEKSTRLIQAQITKEESARRLAAAYSAILAWPDPRETETELASANLGGETEASSAGETSVVSDAQPDSSTETDEMASGVDPTNTDSGE